MFFPRRLAAIAALLWLTFSTFAQTINPADYGNIVLRLKAEDLGYANGAAVTNWGLFTAGGTATPTMVTSDARFNTKPVVRFDGADDVLKFPAANTNARTIFAVVTLESSPVSLAGLLGRGDDKLNIRRNGTTNFYRSPLAGQDTNDLSGVVAGGNLFVNNVASGVYPPSVAHIVMAVAGANQTYTNFWIGSPSASLSRYWNGSVAEIIVYDGVLTQTGIDRVGWYLQNKYNVPSGGYPAPTPQINSFTAAAGGITASTGVLSTADAPITLAWNVANATSVSINNGALASPGGATGSVSVSPSATTTYTLTATNAAGSATRSVTVYIGLTPQSLVLNEFLADNGSSVLDEDGTKQDWIEIYNPNPFAVSANGWQLANGAVTWTFPNFVVEGGAYPIVFASGKNRTNPAAPLHTNFSLGKDGEYLALKMPDTNVATEFAPAYPVQRTDVSCGKSAGSSVVYFPTPTPGAVNSATTLAGFVEDTSFSVNRGFFTTSQSVALTCATPGATIRYTTDNSTPTDTNGTVYSAPVTITATTVLRARAFVSSLLASNVDTQTYVFVTDVPGQVYAAGTAPAGWPVPGAAQLNAQLMRYGFNATLKAQYTTQQLTNALNQVPSLSIVTDHANLTAQATGIYSNADQKGDAWERAASVEYLPQDNSTGFHLNCGLRIRGGASRGDNYPKHSFRLYFRNQYGDGMLKFPLHGGTGTDEFQTIDIRSEENYSWAHDTGTENTAVREVFARDLSGALGQPQTRSRYLHVYLNGQYWGLYMTEERSQEDYGATYFGGAANDYHVIQTSNHPNFTYELSSGTVDAWQQTWNLARACAANPSNANYFALLGRDPNGVRVPAMPVYIDPDHLATYMLLHYYTGDGDGPLSNFLSMNRANNWRGSRNRLTNAGWRFFPHDCEHTLFAPSWVNARATNNTTTGTNRSNFTYSNSEWIHEDLATNAEYKLKIADVAQKHLFNNGALTSAKGQALFDARAAQIGQAIVADCTRWGTNATSHTLAQWNARLASIRSSFFPTRAVTVLGHLQSRGFYPTATPPVFSQRGGQVSAGYGLTLSPGAQTGTIFYTLDGTDPRAIGGAAVGTAYTMPIVVNAPVLVRTRFRSSALVWSAIDEAAFTIYPPATAANLVVTKVHYHPPGLTAAESAAGYTADDYFEYMELMNIGATTLDLTGVTLSDAVTFAFYGSSITTLAPGARVLVVANAGAFSMRYGGGLPVAGAFTGSFHNSGELVRVLGAGGAAIKQFTYDDLTPWPTAADGSGSVLVLVNPAANPDPNVAANWRASYVPGGVPGAVDEWTIARWRAQYFNAADLANPALEATLWGASADPDGDGFRNAVEFTMGSAPTISTSRPAQTTSLFTDPGTSQTYLRITCSLREGITGISYVAKSSGDLTTWSTGPQHLGTLTQLDGTLLTLWQDDVPLGSAPGGRRYLRMEITVP